MQTNKMRQAMLMSWTTLPCTRSVDCLLYKYYFLLVTLLISCLLLPYFQHRTKMLCLTTMIHLPPVMMSLLHCPMMTNLLSPTVSPLPLAVSCLPPTVRQMSRLLSLSTSMMRMKWHLTKSRPLPPTREKRAIKSPTIRSSPTLLETMVHRPASQNPRD